MGFLFRQREKLPLSAERSSWGAKRLGTAPGSGRIPTSRPPLSRSDGPLNMRGSLQPTPVPVTPGRPEARGVTQRFRFLLGGSGENRSSFDFDGAVGFDSWADPRGRPARTSRLFTRGSGALYKIYISVCTADALIESRSQTVPSGATEIWKLHKPGVPLPDKSLLPVSYRIQAIEKEKQKQKPTKRNNHLISIHTYRAVCIQTQKEQPNRRHAKPGSAHWRWGAGGESAPTTEHGRPPPQPLSSPRGVQPGLAQPLRVAAARKHRTALLVLSLLLRDFFPRRALLFSPVCWKVKWSCGRFLYIDTALRAGAGWDRCAGCWVFFGLRDVCLFPFPRGS